MSTSIISKLGIRGWAGIEDELLSTLLTGDPLLLIGARGSAKTHAARLIAAAFNESFVAYDASKAMFDDVLGFPNIEKMKQGLIEYIPSPITIWNKRFVLIDELNRAVPELQSKWLEIIRSRQIMGMKTQIKWVWSAMNPTTYDGAIQLDPALEGRFSLFLRPPDLSDMSDEDRQAVIMNVTCDDMPAFDVWTTPASAAMAMIEKSEDADLLAFGDELRKLLVTAAIAYDEVTKKFENLKNFLGKILKVAHDESKGKLHIDGRRGGMIYRAIIATRSIQYAKKQIYGDELPDLQDVVISVLKASLSGSDDELYSERQNVVLAAFNLFGGYFNDNIKASELAYSVLTEDDVLVRWMKMVQNKDMNETLKYKIWKDLVEMDETKCGAYCMIAIWLNSLNKKIPFIPEEIMPKILEGMNLPTRTELTGHDAEYGEEVQRIIEEDSTGRGQAIALLSVHEELKEGPLSDRSIAAIRERIRARHDAMGKVAAAIKVMK